jgi:hypothetical protein
MNWFKKLKGWQKAVTVLVALLVFSLLMKAILPTTPPDEAIANSNWVYELEMDRGTILYEIEGDSYTSYTINPEGFQKIISDKWEVKDNILILYSNGKKVAKPIKSNTDDEIEFEKSKWKATKLSADQYVDKLNKDIYEKYKKSFDKYGTWNGKYNGTLISYDVNGLGYYTMAVVGSGTGVAVNGEYSIKDTYVELIHENGKMFRGKYDIRGGLRIHDENGNYMYTLKKEK